MTRYALVQARVECSSRSIVFPSMCDPNFLIVAAHRSDLDEAAGYRRVVGSPGRAHCVLDPRRENVPYELIDVVVAGLAAEANMYASFACEREVSPDTSVQNRLHLHEF